MFRLRNKKSSPSLLSLVKTKATIWENSRKDQRKLKDAVKDFHLLGNSGKLFRGFSQAMKAWRTCFISFIKLFCLLRKKTIYEARMHNLISFMKL